MLASGVCIDRHRKALSEAIETWALEQSMMAIVNGAITLAALGVSSGAEVVEVGMGGVVDR